MLNKHVCYISCKDQVWHNIYWRKSCHWPRFGFLKMTRNPWMCRAQYWGIQGVMHGNEPLKKQPKTQIKMEQPRHSLTPHLDSFTKSTPSLSPPKPNQNVLKTAESSLSLGCACPPALACQGHSGPIKVLCGWEGKWWAAGNWEGREISSLICCQTPLSDLYLSI